MEPLTNVIGVGTPVVLADLELLETNLVSIAITLDPALLPGEAFTYVIAVDNGNYTYRDTLTKAYGAAEAVSYTHLDVYKRQSCMRSAPKSMV